MSPTIQILSQVVYDFVEEEIIPFVDWEELATSIKYWQNRHQQFPRYAATDIIPTLTCILADGDYRMATPLSAWWLFYVLAARIFDDIQDQEGQEKPWQQRGLEQSLPTGLTLLAAANTCLGCLGTDSKTLRQLLSALGRTWTLAAKSQSFPAKEGCTLAQYFQQIITNTAELFAAAAWCGARLVTTDEEILSRVRAYGHNIGLMSAIVSDCYDLQPGSDKVSDLAIGLHKLPVIYALSLKEHPFYHALTTILAQSTLTTAEAEDAVSILQGMGAINWSLQMATMYQQEALRALSPFPMERKEHLVKYAST